MYSLDKGHQTCELTYVTGPVNTCLHLWKFETWSFVCKGLTIICYACTSPVLWAVLLSSQTSDYTGDSEPGLLEPLVQEGCTVEASSPRWSRAHQSLKASSSSMQQFLWAADLRSQQGLLMTWWTPRGHATHSSHNQHGSAQLLSGIWPCNAMDCSPQAPLSMGFSRQEHWSR